MNADAQLAPLPPLGWRGTVHEMAPSIVWVGLPISAQARVTISTN